VIDAPAKESRDDRFFPKSFLKTRVVIGVIGVLLPLVLVVGNRMVFGQSGILPSLSDYYHSDMRNWFVGSLWAIGSGLLVYLAARRELADSQPGVLGADAGDVSWREGRSWRPATR
jgi:hypothetical protein